MSDILIVGAGVLGKALGAVFPRGRADVSYYDTDPAMCPGGCVVLESAVPDARCIFLCVPSWGMRAAAARIAVHVTPSAAVISLAKGLESPDAKSMYDVCTEVLPQGQPFAVLGGALLAAELSGGLPGMGIVGCADDTLRHALGALFADSPVHLDWTSDARSVAVAGVLKNVYAIMLGINDGLQMGSNLRGWLFSQAVREMTVIGARMRLDPRIVLSVAGVGDLAATGLSPDSKNRTAGLELARTGVTGIRCEGIVSLPLVRQLIGNRERLPLLDALDEIVSQRRDARSVLRSLVEVRYTGEV
ncbi:MAG TPA: hypothetical protein VMJ72_01400 [Candidatus Paceibacterota bacterium]|nr:hypothetical protein [Candidatus Paceibacterota bacterium]